VAEGAAEDGDGLEAPDGGRSVAEEEGGTMRDGRGLPRWLDSSSAGSCGG